MPNVLPELEAERSKILRQFTTLGDLRRGSICAVSRRCGKPSCHCAIASYPEHDPQVRLTRKVDGKTVAESFPSPATWRKAKSEIDEYYRFHKLSTELIAVNEKPKSSEEPLEVHRGGCQDRVDLISGSTLQPITFQPIAELTIWRLRALLLSMPRRSEQYAQA